MQQHTRKNTTSIREISITVRDPRPMISDQTYYISGRLSRLARDMFLGIARAHNFGREAEPFYSAASREGAQV